jgi:hypothetical protein
LTFDFILLPAVWMHVPPASRARALCKLSTLLAPNGRIAISLRLGEPDAARAMHVVSLSELTALSQQFSLRLQRSNDSEGRLGRTGVAKGCQFRQLAKGCQFRQSDIFELSQRAVVVCFRRDKNVRSGK